MQVSIITINYNNLEGLRKTRDSIMSQTFGDKEWLVIDGGSTHGDREWITQHQAETAFWCSEPDGGVYNAMNKGIAKAQGNYLVFMNSGDTFHDATVLESVFRAMPEADILYGDWMQVYPDGTSRLMPAPRTFSLHFICTENICHQAMFVKREVMARSPYDETYRLYADWAKWIELALQGCTFCYVPCVVCDYQMDGMSQLQAEVIQEETTRLKHEAIPPAMHETLKFFRKSRGVPSLLFEVERLASQKGFYKKLIQNCVGFIHVLEKLRH